MKRRLLNLLTLVSLLLVVAVVGLSCSGRIVYFGGRRQLSVAAELGRLRVMTADGSRHVLEVIDVPVYVVVLGCVVLPAMSLQALWKRWRDARAASRVGFCPRCGYDLRATPGRCPVCGQGTISP